MYTGQIKLIIERKTSNYLVEIGLGLTSVELCHLPMIYLGNLGYTSFIQVLKHDIDLVLKVTILDQIAKYGKYCMLYITILSKQIRTGQKQIDFWRENILCRDYLPICLFGKSYKEFETTKISENAPFNQSDPFGLWTDVFFIYKPYLKTKAKISQTECVKALFNQIVDLLFLLIWIFIWAIYYHSKLY